MPGDPVLFRSIYGGHVRWCFPGRYVGDWQGRHGVYCQPGNEGRSLRRSPEGRYLQFRAGFGPDAHLRDVATGRPRLTLLRE